MEFVGGCRCDLGEAKDGTQREEEKDNCSAGVALKRQQSQTSQLINCRNPLIAKNRRHRAQPKVPDSFV
jgi:hypothetical protein